MSYGGDTLPKVLNASRRFPTSEDWDDRFHLSHIPAYDAAKDKYMRKMKPPAGSMGIVQMRKTMKVAATRPGSISKLAPMSRAMSRSKTRDVLVRARSNPKFRLSKAEEDSYMELQNRLAAAWMAWGVPAGQRVDFQKVIPVKGKSMTDMMRDELSRLEATHHPTKIVEKAIERREGILSRVQLLVDLDDNRQIEAAELLGELRAASLDVVESVLKWRDFTHSSASYLYEGQSYFAKMKADTDFLHKMDHWFYIAPESDPFLLYAAGARTFSKHFPKAVKGDMRIPLPLMGNELQRIKQAEVVLNAEREEYKENRQENRRPSHNLIPTILTPAPPEDMLIVDYLSSLESRTLLTPIWRLDDLSNLIVEQFISILVTDSVTTIVVESCKDVVAASLTLYSSTILDRLIVLVLEMEIPLCARESYSEELDREYIAFQQEIVEAAVTFEVKKWAEIWVRIHIAEDIARSYAQIVPVEEVVQESIAEETKLNKDLMVVQYNNIVEAFITQEWFEILCENEFSEAILEERYRELPANVVRKLRKDRPEQEFLRIGEELYREMLYAYVSSLWLTQLVTLVLEENESEDEDKAIFAFEIAVTKRTSQGMGRYYMS